MLELDFDDDLERERASCRADLLLSCAVLGAEVSPRSLKAAAAAADLSKLTSAEPPEAEGWAGLLAGVPMGIGI